MGAIFDRLVIVPSVAQDYARVPHSQDRELFKDLINAAKEEADEIVNNPFLVEDPENPGEFIDGPIPTAIKLDVLKLITWNYEFRNPGVSTEREGGLSVTRKKPTFSAFNQYRCRPGLGGTPETNGDVVELP